MPDMHRSGVQLCGRHEEREATTRQELSREGAGSVLSFTSWCEMDHLFGSAFSASSALVNSIVSNVMATTNQLMISRHSEDVSSEAGSTESGDNNFLILTEDHFAELAEDELDPTGLPIDQRNVERAIRRYMKLIRCEETDTEKKKKLIIKLCELRIKLNQMNEEMDEKYLNGHRFNNKLNSSNSDPHRPALAPSSGTSLTCDVCLKKQTMQLILLPPTIFKTYRPNFILSCDFCDFKIHRNCIDSYVRRCPRLLFQEEEEDDDDEQEQLEEEQRVNQQEDRQSLKHDANDDAVNHSNHATRAGSSSARQQDKDQEVTSSITTSNGNSSAGMDMGSAKKRVKYSQYLQLSICPEIGLSKQSFKCADCEEVINFTTSRICDYDGQYYCFSCHWNDMERTPARILHNWDSCVKPVSRRSLQIITFIKRKPVLFDVLDFNPMLYGLVEDLPLIKRLRLELTQMAHYIRICRQPAKPKLAVSSYLISEEESSGGHSFSLTDLINLSQLKKQLVDLHGQLLAHITLHCEGCRGKGFFCDHCKDKVDLLFPFSANTSSCPECGTVYHRNCYHRKHKTCLKCQRMRQKLQNSCISEKADEEEDGMENRSREHQLQEQKGDENTDRHRDDAFAAAQQQRKQQPQQQELQVTHQEATRNEYCIGSTAVAAEAENEEANSIHAKQEDAGSAGDPAA